MAVLITGGAGFVGSSLAFQFKKGSPDLRVVCFDNLKRRGSELNLIKFKELGIEFVHGDIRHIEDFNSIEGDFDLMIDACAEPSVHAGLDGDVKYLIDTNLNGTINCLQFAKKRVSKTIFLSTSRIYSIDPLIELPLKEDNSRLILNADVKLPLGVSLNGIGEGFSISSFRSLYGSTKLCSEMIIHEYRNNFNMNIAINRCGVIAGRGQWGKVDQGVFTLWVANHYFSKTLKYTGFGGTGKQVRDLLHPIDLFHLIEKQIESESDLFNDTYNVGGGLECSTSLLELSRVCENVTGNKINISSEPETSPMDIPYYITDNTKASSAFDWEPKYKTQDIVKDIYDWLVEEEDLVRNIFN